MRSRDPPKLATWLLKHACSRYRRECLTGDLMEEYRAGRSNAWHWRQVLWAIAANASHVVRALSPAGLALLTWWSVLVLLSVLWKWPAIIFALDPGIYCLYRQRRKRRRSQGPCQA